MDALDLAREERKLSELQLVQAEKNLTIAKANLVATVFWAISFVVLGWEVAHHLTFAVGCH
jgi:hypothetical protein